MLASVCGGLSCLAPAATETIKDSELMFCCYPFPLLHQPYFSLAALRWHLVCCSRHRHFVFLAYRAWRKEEQVQSARDRPYFISVIVTWKPIPIETSDPGSMPISFGSDFRCFWFLALPLWRCSVATWALWSTTSRRDGRLDNIWLRAS